MAQAVQAAGQAVRIGLIKKIIKRGVDLAKDDPAMIALLRENPGESMLFYIKDLKAPFGIQIEGTTLTFKDNPDITQPYSLIAQMTEDTVVRLIKGLDPMDAFFYNLIDVTGKGWFKRVMILRKIFKLGEERGLKQKVIH